MLHLANYFISVRGRVRIDVARIFAVPKTNTRKWVTGYWVMWIGWMGREEAV